MIKILMPLAIGNTTFLTLLPGFAIDRMSALFLLLTALIASASFAHAQVFFKQEETSGHGLQTAYVRQYYILATLFVVAMMAVYASDNLGFLWISIEATTLLSAGLVYFHRTKNALEATWKYFIICSVGIAFALLGTIFIFASSQHDQQIGSLSCFELVKLAPNLDLGSFKIGFIFCFLGYGTKAGIFPLHSWLPDAHSEAPAPASALLSGSLLNCALFAIWRIYQIAQATGRCQFIQDVTIWAGAVTVVAAALFLVRQYGIKRLWAYSSIENVGLMLVAIGLNSPFLFFLQAINHSLAKVSLFLISGNIIQSTGTKYLKDIRGVFRFAPVWGIVLALSALAVAGVPPFGSFVSEWMILTENFNLKYIIPAILIIFGLTLTFIAVCLHIGPLLLGTPKSTSKIFRPIASSVVPVTLLIGSLILGLTVGYEGLIKVVR
jgi:hydrogenase-4 component F